MTMPQLDTEGFGLLREVDSAAQKELCSCGEPLSSAAPSPPGPSYIVKFTIDYTDAGGYIDYTDVMILMVILIILLPRLCCPIRIERNTAVTRKGERGGEDGNGRVGSG